MAAMTIGTTFCVYMISQIIRQEFIVDICPDKPTCICYGLPFRSCLEQYKTDIEVSQNCMLLSEAKANLIVDRFNKGQLKFANQTQVEDYLVSKGYPDLFRAKEEQELVTGLHENFFNTVVSDPPVQKKKPRAKNPIVTSRQKNHNKVLEEIGSLKTEMKEIKKQLKVIKTFEIANENILLYVKNLSLGVNNQIRNYGDICQHVKKSEKERKDEIENLKIVIQGISDQGNYIEETVGDIKDSNDIIQNTLSEVSASVQFGDETGWATGLQRENNEGGCLDNSPAIIDAISDSNNITIDLFKETFRELNKSFALELRKETKRVKRMENQFANPVTLLLELKQENKIFKDEVLEEIKDVQNLLGDGVDTNG